MRSSSSTPSERSRRIATAEAGIRDDEVLRCVVTRDAQGRERLRVHNRMRDQLVKQLRVIYLRAGSAADVRFLREVAPDLTATIDVFVEIGTIEGRVERLDTLIEAILRKSRRRGRYDAKYPSLLIGLLAESPGLSRRQIDRLVGRLLDFVFTKVYSFGASFQVHAEFVTLLRDAHGSVRESLSAALATAFSVDSGIQWDRVFPWAGVGDVVTYNWKRLSIRSIVQLGLCRRNLQYARYCGRGAGKCP